MTTSQPPSRWYGARPPSPVAIHTLPSFAPRDRALTAAWLSAPKLMPLMLKKLGALYGSWQAPGPSATPISLPGQGCLSSSSTGKGALRNTKLGTLALPKLIRLETPLAERYTQLRSSRLNGRSAQSGRYWYCRMYSPQVSTKYLAWPITG